MSITLLEKKSLKFYTNMQVKQNTTNKYFMLFYMFLAGLKNFKDFLELIFYLNFNLLIGINLLIFIFIILS